MAKQVIKAYMPLGQIAELYGVAEISVRRWHKAGCPLQDGKMCADWLLRRNVEDRVRAAAERTMGYPPGSTSVDNPTGEIRDTDGEDSALFDSIKGRIGADTPLAQLEIFRDFHAAKAEASTKLGDRAEADYHTKRLREFEQTLNAAKLTAKRLGIDNGELLRKDDAEKYGRAVAYWLCRCVDASRRRLRERLVGMRTAQEVDAVLDAELLASALVIPMARGMRVDGATYLPDWMHAAITDAVDDYVEDGAALVEQESKA